MTSAVPVPQSTQIIALANSPKNNPQFRTRTKKNCTQALAGMRKLGLQTSLSCEGVLQSARSIENALRLSQASPSIVGLPNFSTGAGLSSSSAGGSVDSATRQAAADAREAALDRSRQLLRFVDHNADELLLASEESGRWFVKPPPSSRPRQSSSPPDGSHGGRGGGDPRHRARHQEMAVSVSSESESEGGYSDEEYGEFEGSEEGEDEEEWAHRQERERAQSMERRERERARAALAALRPPPNAFVEELNGIAWLPVHTNAINILMPWQVQLVLLLFCAFMVC